MSARITSTRRRPSAGFALALLALLVATTGTATAAGLLITSKQIKDGTIQAVDISKAAQSQLQHKKKANPFEGTWKVTITRTEAGAPPPFSAYVSFGAGHTAAEVNQNNQSTALGSWVEAGARQIRYTVTRFRFSPTGAYVGTLTPIETDTLGATGNAFDGTSTVEVRNANGDVIANGAANTHGIRISP